MFIVVHHAGGLDVFPKNKKIAIKINNGDSFTL